MSKEQALESVRCALVNLDHMNNAGGGMFRNNPFFTLVKAQLQEAEKELEASE